MKAGIVAATAAPVVRGADVILRHGHRPAQLSIWRRLAPQGEIVSPIDDGPNLAPLLVDEASSAPSSGGLGEASVELEVGELTVLRLPVDSAPIG